MPTPMSVSLIPVGEQVDFTFGGRFTYAHADVGQLQDFGTGNPIGFRDDYSALTGSARAQVFLDSERRFSIFGGASQAFRAPNLSDVSRLDDFGTDGFEIPATNLDPEEFTQLEIGVKSDTEFAQVQAAYYYTLIDNLILRVPSGPNPTDPSQTLFVKQNSGDGYVQGVEVGARIRLFPSVSLFGTFGWQEGEVDFVNNSNQVERDDLSRLLPTSGIVGLRYDDPQEDLFLELVANLADQQDNLSVRDRSDTSRIPPNGTPGYAVYSIRSGWEFNEDVTLFAAVENLLDEDYRIHGSGVNEPGRNFVFSAEYRF